MNEIKRRPPCTNRLRVIAGRDRDVAAAVRRQLQCGRTRGSVQNLRVQSPAGSPASDPDKRRGSITTSDRGKMSPGSSMSRQDVGGSQLTLTWPRSILNIQAPPLRPRRHFGPNLQVQPTFCSRLEKLCSLVELIRPKHGSCLRALDVRAGGGGTLCGLGRAPPCRREPGKKQPS